MTNKEKAEFRAAVAKVFKDKTLTAIGVNFFEMCSITETVYWEAIAAAETEKESQAILAKDNETMSQACCSCKWYREYVCVNRESENVAEFTSPDNYCGLWEGKE